MYEKGLRILLILSVLYVLSLQNSESQRLISVTQQGMDYYHNYDRLVLSVHIALGFLGWIFLIVCHLLKVRTCMYITLNVNY